jgi:hypothetical protein
MGIASETGGICEMDLGKQRACTAIGREAQARIAPFGDIIILVCCKQLLLDTNPTRERARPRRSQDVLRYLGRRIRKNEGAA